MTEGFDISASVDVDEKDVDREPHPDNFLFDVVEYSRSRQVLNESQTIVTLLIYATGLLPNWRDYVGGIITGGSSGGKSHMKQNVVDDMFAYVADWLYNPTGTSDLGMIDDPRWEQSKIGALNELQKIPDEMLEFLKSAHGDDGGFDYRRNAPDPDSEGGFSAVSIETEPKPTVFMLADENNMAVEEELRTRLIEVKVDENPEKNKAVHRMKWGHERITIPSSEHAYVWDDEDLEHMVRAHIRDMDAAMDDIDDVIIPTGDDRFEGDHWDASAVMEPLFNFGTSDSTRASSMLASLAKASAALNYHARDTVEFEGETLLVMEPTDVANLIECRDTLLATTHQLTEKKFAVIDAIVEGGVQANSSGTKIQATKQAIEQEIQENREITSLKQSQINNILEELEEDLIIQKTDNPDDRRQNLYIYDGSETFKSPNIEAYYDHFEDVRGPITDQPIERTVEEQLEDLNAKMDMESLGSRGAESPQTGFETVADTDLSSLSETAQIVAEPLSETLDDAVVPKSVMEENSLKIEHMLGIAPIDREYVGDTLWVRPDEAPTGGHRRGTIMDPSDDHWDDEMDFSEVKVAIGDAIDELRETGIFDMDEREDGVAVTVEAGE